jgi:Zn-dependent protease
VNVRPLHPQASVRPSPVFLAILALTAVGGALAWISAAELREPLAYAGVFIFVIAGWIVSLSLHEFGHAFTAWRFGDHDVAVRGYLTLNPFKYASPLMSIGFPVLITLLGGIGLPGGAVWVRTSFMTVRQKSIVSLAGPVMNVLLAILLLVLARVFYDPAHLVFWGAVAFLGFLQITGAVLNLLPVPGLDGYGALEPHLSPETQRALEPAKPWAFFVFLLLLIATPLNQYFFAMVGWFFDLSGVKSGLIDLGFTLTRFWSAWF